MKILADKFFKEQLSGTEIKEYHNNFDILSSTENRNIEDLLDKTCERCVLNMRKCF